MCKALKKKQTIIYSVIAVVLFGLLFGCTYLAKREVPETTEARIVMLGDSILGSCRDETSVSAKLSKMLGEPVFNGALGGTGMGFLDGERRLANAWESLSMYMLSKAIISGDFRTQQIARIREPGVEYFAPAIDELETIDFESVDILFIEHALNDYHNGVPIYNEEDPYDSCSFTGALRSVIETFQEKYPDMRIILITPTYGWYIIYADDEVTCENHDLGGGVLEDYVNAEIQLAESMGVEVIDLYHDFYFHEQWSDWEVYTTDGVHPNETGRAMIAEEIYNYLMEN